jgi:hypothetical protein
MVKFGIHTEEQYLRLGESRRALGAHAAYNLLNVGDHPSQEQIRIFEDVSFTLRTSNGTFRTTFRNRFDNVADLTLKWIGEFYPPGSRLSVQDRAVSHGLTSKEFAERIFAVYPEARFEASDLLLGLVELTLSSGEVYITEQNGKALQYIKAPFVVSLQEEPRRYPLNRWVSARALRRFEKLSLPAGWTGTSGGPGFQVRQIPFIHPEARSLSRNNPHFMFCERSIFDRTPGACQVLRTMNIFNRAYFTDQQLADGAAAVFESLEPGGIWIVGRTLEENFTNHVTFLRRTGSGWDLLGRFGEGSEMEGVALGNTAKHTSVKPSLKQ